MSFALLWIELLAVSLLWIAAMSACISRVRSDWLRISLMIAAFVPPVVVLGFGLGLSIWAKFAEGLEHNWFWYSCPLMLAFVAGAVVIVRIGRRSDATGAIPRDAISWPRARLAVALLAAASVGLMTIWNMDLTARLKADYMQLQAGALVLSALPSVPDSQNAAFIYQKAFELTHADSQTQKMDADLMDGDIDPTTPEMEEALQRQTHTLALVRQATALTGCRFDHDYSRPSISMMIPEVNDLRFLADLVRLHARNQLAKGNPQAAIEDANEILVMGHHIGQEPILVCDLRSFVLDQMAAQILEDALPSVTRADQLGSWNAADPLLIRHNLQRAMDGEEGFGLSVSSDLVAGNISFGDIENGGPRSGQPIAVPVALAYRIFLASDDIDEYMNGMGEYRQAVQQPYYRAAKMSDSFGSTGSGKPTIGLFSRVLAPSLHRFVAYGARVEAGESETIVAVAMTRYRLDHGQLPMRLEDLVPNYLDEIPIDPFDGKPLRLAIKENQWTIYSVGPDQVDDNGADLQEIKDLMAAKGDVPFRLKFAANGVATQPGPH